MSVNYFAYKHSLRVAGFCEESTKSSVKAEADQLPFGYGTRYLWCF